MMMMMMMMMAIVEHYTEICHNHCWNTERDHRWLDEVMIIVIHHNDNVVDDDDDDDDDGDSRALYWDLS